MRWNGDDEISFLVEESGVPGGNHRPTEEWRLAKLTVIDKLKISDLILLLSSTDGPLLRYMRVFRIMQNVQVKFVSGILYVLCF